jgi:hypothetical protein
MQPARLDHPRNCLRDCGRKFAPRFQGTQMPGVRQDDELRPGNAAPEHAPLALIAAVSANLDEAKNGRNDI